MFPADYNSASLNIPSSTINQFPFHCLWLLIFSLNRHVWNFEVLLNPRPHFIYNMIRSFGTPLSITLEYFIADATMYRRYGLFNNDDCIPIFLPHFKCIAYLFRQHGGDDDVSFAAVFSLPWHQYSYTVSIIFLSPS